MTTPGEIYSTDEFQYDCEKKQFSAPISRAPGALRFLYQNDLAIGFFLRSSRTNRVVAFHLMEHLDKKWIFSPEEDPDLKSLGVIAVIYVDN